ncbi:J domain-containing protein [Adelges cooleyi]|uniref:J domain-containing protein n=1 Tax=Adelges cooleyi TaxID=133065 RepID=UPI0021805076|nr:J domain-containing protein [Adelges cooleyi]
MTTVSEILSYDKSAQDDFYALLGCDLTSTVEQINAEFKVRALQYHPDKNAGDKTSEEIFQKLNEAKETLCDPEKRATYDKWKNSGVAVSYKTWLNNKEHFQQSMHWANMKTKDRMLPGGEGPSSGSVASRRASEGGVNLGASNVKWDAKSNADIINKFRNYEI